MIELSEIKGDLTWYKVMDYSQKLGEGWKLPDIWELYTMYEAKRLGHPGLQDMNGWFWSSSPYMDDTNDAWNMCFNYGYVNRGYKATGCNARCVRVEGIDELVTWVLEKKSVKKEKMSRKLDRKLGSYHATIYFDMCNKYYRGSIKIVDTNYEVWGSCNVDIKVLLEEAEKQLNHFFEMELDFERVSLPNGWNRE